MHARRQFANLLVPLDGSRLAESVVPTVRELALHLCADVTLLHVLEQHPPTTVHGERHLTDRADAGEYLARIAARLREVGIGAQAHVHDNREGDVARSIAEHADELTQDMVVLCAHGRGGLRGLLFGGIAQQVLAKGSWPVLVVQPRPDGGAPEFRPRRILVPLATTHDPKPALDAAATLAVAFGAVARLVVVVPTRATLADERARAGRTLPTTMRAILDLAEQESRRYLADASARLSAAGLTIEEEVARGETVTEIRAAADRADADLIVIASHARVGLEALTSGSIGSRLSARAARPILLVRASDPETL